MILKDLYIIAFKAELWSLMVREILLQKCPISPKMPNGQIIHLINMSMFKKKMKQIIWYASLKTHVN